MDIASEALHPRKTDELFSILHPITLDRLTKDIALKGVTSRAKSLFAGRYWRNQNNEIENEYDTPHRNVRG